MIRTHHYKLIVNQFRNFSLFPRRKSSRSTKQASRFANQAQECPEAEEQQQQQNGGIVLRRRRSRRRRAPSPSPSTPICCSLSSSSSSSPLPPPQPTAAVAHLLNLVRTAAAVFGGRERAAVFAGGGGEGGHSCWCDVGRESATTQIYCAFCHSNHGWTKPLGVSVCVLLLLHLFHAALVYLVHLLQNKP